MKAINSIVLLIMYCIFTSCGESKTNDAILSEVKFRTKPESCLLFIQSTEFTETCINNTELDINVHIETDNACSIDIIFPGLNGGNFDVEFYYETDPDKMESFHVIAQGHRGSLIPESTSRDINDLGDMGFISTRPMLDQKVLVTTIDNVRVIISSKTQGNQNHCMYADEQLEKLARALLKKIN